MSDPYNSYDSTVRKVDRPSPRQSPLGWMVNKFVASTGRLSFQKRINQLAIRAARTWPGIILIGLFALGMGAALFSRELNAVNAGVFSCSSRRCNGTWTAVGDPIMFWIIISILTAVSLISICGLAILIHGKIVGRLESIGSVG